LVHWRAAAVVLTFNLFGTERLKVTDEPIDVGS